MAHTTAKLLFASRLRRRSAAQSRRHKHASFWQAEYVIHGPIHYQIDRHTFPLPEGALLLIPPAHSHQQNSPQGAGSYLLKFRLSSSPIPLSEPTILQLSGAERRTVEHLLLSLIHEHDGRAEARNEMIATLLTQLLVHVGRWSKSLPAPGPSSSYADSRQRVRLVGDMLRRKHSRSFSVDELAKQAHLSRSRFVELFRTQFGTSPTAFHRRVRMEKAVELARYTGMSWRQIAANLGYDDPAYFSRAFKKTMGASPSIFLSQNR